MTTMDCSEMIFASLDVQPSKYLLCAFDEILGFNEKCRKVFWLAIMQIVEKIPMKCFVGHTQNNFIYAMFFPKRRGVEPFTVS